MAKKKEEEKKEERRQIPRVNEKIKHTFHFSQEIVNLRYLLMVMLRQSQSQERMRPLYSV